MNSPLYLYFQRPNTFPLAFHYISCINNPLLNLGSNHVDFGGITLLLSAIFIISSMAVGYIEKATPFSVLSTNFSNTFSPLIPPTKSILLSFLGSFIYNTYQNHIFL